MTEEGAPREEAVVPSDPPLVSIIVRTMGRPELEEALASLAAQTWERIEVVLVDARGTPPVELPVRCGRFPVRAVRQGRPLGRSAAGNAGLDAAMGDLIGFLDEDDLVDADHVASLVGVLVDHPQAVAAYSGVRCTGDAELSAWFNRPFSRTWLALGNYIPLHAVLVRRGALGPGCRLDETLDVYEDWDLWLQLARQGEFVHLDRATAAYRTGGGSGAGLSGEAAVMKAGRARVLSKWMALWSGSELDAILTECAEQMRRVPVLEAELRREREARAELAAALERVEASWSWRMTAWVRWLAALGRRPELPPS